MKRWSASRKAINTDASKPEINSSYFICFWLYFIQGEKPDGVSIKKLLAYLIISSAYFKWDT